MPAAPHRYRSGDEDSARWLGFAFRPGDIVISTRSKSGTTWLQMICALLVLQTPRLPAPLADLSPWLDWLGTPRDEVCARLSAQQHRRFIKTHTPLDGVPLDPGVTYLVGARHPLDLAVSLYHHSANLDRARMRQLTGRPEPEKTGPRPPVDAWVHAWIDRDADPRKELDSLPGVLWHLSDAWARRRQPNVLLVHYDDLSAGLEDQMRRLARLLGITVPDTAWPGLVEAATFEQMRRRARDLVPDRSGLLKDPAAFFRQGTSRSGHQLLPPDALARYAARAAALASADLLTWLHRDRQGRP